MSYGILFLRLVVGLTIAAHGAQKLPGLFGGGGPKGTAASFASLGFRPAAPMAYLAALGELSGLLLAAGLATPLAALAIVVVMLTAIITVHWKNGFFSGGGGYEFNLVLLAAAAAVAATGPGRFSVDRAIGWDDRISGAWWGVGVLAAGLALAALNVALFRRAPRPAETAS